MTVSYQSTFSLSNP